MENGCRCVIGSLLERSEWCGHEALMGLADGGFAVMPKVAQIANHYINSSFLCIWDKGYRHFFPLKTIVFGIFMPF